jgi:RNA polymerase sigma factor (sigma-70 family)
MAMSPTYYLVDHNGKPLSARYQAAVAHLHETFVRRFPKLSDPADLSNAVEEIARRVATYEIRYGEVNNLHSFMARAYSNLVTSMLRTGYYTQHESPTSDHDLEVLAASKLYRGEQKIENVVLARQALDMLDQRKRRLLVMSAEGFTAREISVRLGISERNVNTCLHRARARVKKRS